MLSNRKHNMLPELGRVANVRSNVHPCKTSGNPSTKGEPHSNCITQHKCNFSAGGAQAQLTPSAYWNSLKNTDEISCPGRKYLLC